ncbi:MAG: ABC transporter ATP-binding protein [Myxococcota bacterium]|nr:ABC transporter ATP-binding protein [Myxococcota bacterium]
MIRLEKVEKRYGKFQALHPLSLNIEAGEVFGFLGPNGAGKTTTIRTLAGVLTPTAGNVFIKDVDIVKNPVQSKRNVGYIPDRPYLYEKLTAREFLQFVGGIYKLDPKETQRSGDRLLEENGLSDRADELIEAYSHGMKQRLTLCSALLHQPDVLIVDEPMVGLDPHGAKKIKEKFRLLAEEGKTVFLSTHSLDVAQEVCDRVGILFKGRLVALDTVDELLQGKASQDLEEVFLKITQEEIEKSSSTS